MDDIILGKDLFNQNKFDESVQCFIKILKDDRVSVEEKNICYEYLIKINELLCLDHELDLVEDQYLDFLKKEKLNIIRVKMLKKKLKKKFCKNRTTKLFELWELLATIGKLDQAKQVIRLLIDLLKEQKNTGKLNTVLKDYLQSYGDDEYYQTALLESYSIEGKWDEIDQYLEKQICEKPMAVLDFYPRTYGVLDGLIDDEDLLIGKYQYLALYYIFSLLLQFNKYQKEVQKELINIIFETIAINGICDKMLLIILEYIKVFKSWQILFDVDYYVEFAKNICQNKSVLASILDKIATLKALAPKKSLSEDIGESKADVHDNFGELIKQKNQNDQKSTEVQKLERDILFLKSIGNKKKVKEKLKQLKQQDGNNTIIENAKESGNLENGLDPRKDLEEILHKICLQTCDQAKVVPDNIHLNEVAFTRYLETLDQQLAKKYYEDIVVALFVTGMSEAALFFLNKVKSDSVINCSDQINFKMEYLKIAILLEMNRYSDVIIGVDDVIGKMPLRENEKVDFLYLKGEALRKINKKKEALKIFKQIVKRQKNYRMVEARIKELE